MYSIRLCMSLVLMICSCNETMGCTWMRTQPKSLSMFKSFISKSITVLQEKDDGEPLISLPNKLYRQFDDLKADDQIVFISRTLKAIMHLYSSGKYESTLETERIDTFIHYLSRQTMELDQCIKAMNPTLSKSVKRANKKMNSHFKFLKNYLKGEEFNGKAWIEIKRVVLAHLRRIVLT
ncbi:interferon a3-like [Esox lucius]|uniref:Uncharacterized protein n=1 Tax=Esox lucius TaxID=8010 RepID=A0A3P9A1W4_ESOLU|nr:interferon a3-like [Esox lucius]